MTNTCRASRSQFPNHVCSLCDWRCKLDEDPEMAKIPCSMLWRMITPPPIPRPQHWPEPLDDSLAWIDTLTPPPVGVPGRSFEKSYDERHLADMTDPSFSEVDGIQSPNVEFTIQQLVEQVELEARQAPRYTQPAYDPFTPCEMDAYYRAPPNRCRRRVRRPRHHRQRAPLPLNLRAPPLRNVRNYPRLSCPAPARHGRTMAGTIDALNQSYHLENLFDTTAELRLRSLYETKPAKTNSTSGPYNPRDSKTQQTRRRKTLLNEEILSRRKNMNEEEHDDADAKSPQTPAGENQAPQDISQDISQDVSQDMSQSPLDGLSQTPLHDMSIMDALRAAHVSIRQQMNASPELRDAVLNASVAASTPGAASPVSPSAALHDALLRRQLHYQAMGNHRAAYQRPDLSYSNMRRPAAPHRAPADFQTHAPPSSLYRPGSLFINRSNSPVKAPPAALNNSYSASTPMGNSPYRNFAQYVAMNNTQNRHNTSAASSLQQSMLNSTGASEMMNQSMLNSTGASESSNAAINQSLLNSTGASEMINQSLMNSTGASDKINQSLLNSTGASESSAINQSLLNSTGASESANSAINQSLLNSTGASNSTNSTLKQNLLDSTLGSTAHNRSGYFDEPSYQNITFDNALPYEDDFDYLDEPYPEYADTSYEDCEGGYSDVFEVPCNRYDREAGNGMLIEIHANPTIVNYPNKEPLPDLIDRIDDLIKARQADFEKQMEQVYQNKLDSYFDKYINKAEE